MTEFTKKKFSVAVGSEDYRANWDQVFGKKPTVQEAIAQLGPTEALGAEFEACSQCGEAPRGQDPRLDGALRTCVFCGYFGIPPGPMREALRAERERQASSAVPVECCKGSREGAPKVCQPTCAWARSACTPCCEVYVGDLGELHQPGCTRLSAKVPCTHVRHEDCNEACDCGPPHLALRDLPESLTQPELTELLRCIAQVEYMVEANPAMGPIIEKLTRMLSDE